MKFMPGEMMNDQQFASVKEGASRRFLGKTTPPAQGFMVSRPRSAGGEKDMPESQVSPAAVHQHWTDNRFKALQATPSHAQSEVYQGIWKDKDDSNHTYLDVSDRVGHFHNAVSRGRGGDQYSIYDLHRKAVVDLARGKDWNTEKASPTSTKPNVGPSYTLTAKGWK
jgi:hypothetical protein